MRLWDKGGNLDAIIAAFTVGEDPVLDLAWAWQDVVGSAAHVQVQVAAGMITEAEGEALREGLRWILEVSQNACPYGPIYAVPYHLLPALWVLWLREELP